MAGLALAATLVGASPAFATPSALVVAASFVSAQCQGGDLVSVKLTAEASGGTGTLVYKWDWTANGTFDTRNLTNPTVTHLYPDETAVTARVGVRDANRATATDTVTFATPRCG